MKASVNIIIWVLALSSFVLILSSAGDVDMLKSITKDTHGTLTENVPITLNVK